LPEDVYPGTYPLRCVEFVKAGILQGECCPECIRDSKANRPSYIVRHPNDRYRVINVCCRHYDDTLVISGEQWDRVLKKKK